MVIWVRLAVSRDRNGTGALSHQHIRHGGQGKGCVPGLLQDELEEVPCVQ